MLKLCIKTLYKKVSFHKSFIILFFPYTESVPNLENDFYSYWVTFVDAVIHAIVLTALLNHFVSENLLRSDMKWEWSRLCHKFVDAARQSLVSSKFNIL